jgi:hypothetical protein
MSKSLGQIGYEALINKAIALNMSSWLLAVKWDELSDKEKVICEISAKAVEKAVIAEFTNTPQTAFTPELAEKIERELGMRSMTHAERKASDQAVDEILNENNP